MFVLHAPPQFKKALLTRRRFIFHIICRSGSSIDEQLMHMNAKLSKNYDQVNLFLLLFHASLWKRSASSHNIGHCMEDLSKISKTGLGWNTCVCPVQGVIPAGRV
mmetsp:Transcript_51026/g.51433  ORF Transcript_51026/g.51433 Transcript_51026/m.51433 type:complete len:105 (-) Transcript_51026:1153-1467(-)